MYVIEYEEDTRSCAARWCFSAWAAMLDYILGTAQGMLQKATARVPFLDIVLNACLRSVSQVVFINNPWSGLLIWLVLTATSPWQYLLLTATAVVCSVVVSKSIGSISPAAVRAGLYGFSAMLVGAALATVLEIDTGIIPGSIPNDVLSGSITSVVDVSRTQSVELAAAVQVATPIRAVAEMGLSKASGAGLSRGLWPSLGSVLPSSAQLPVEASGSTALIAAIALAAFAGILCAVLTRCMSNVLVSQYGVSPATLPFNVVALLIVLCVAGSDPAGRAGQSGEISLKGPLRWYALRPGFGAHPSATGTATATDALVLAQLALHETMGARSGLELGWIGFCDRYGAQQVLPRWEGFGVASPVSLGPKSGVMVPARSATALARGAGGSGTSTGGVWAADEATRLGEQSAVVGAGSVQGQLSSAERARVSHSSSNATLGSRPATVTITRLPGTSLCVNETAVGEWISVSNSSLSLTAALLEHRSAVAAVAQGDGGAGWEVYTGSDWLQFGLAALRGVAQIYLSSSWEAGFVILVAMALCSPVASLSALAGSVIGNCVAVLLGAAASDVSAGLWGYNSALTTVALAGMLYRLEEASILLALLGAATTALVHGAVATALRPVGLPPFTLPFALTTVALTLLRWPRLLPLTQVLTPESHAKFKVVKLCRRRCTSFCGCFCFCCMGCCTRRCACEPPQPRRRRKPKVPVMVHTAAGRLPSSKAEMDEGAGSVRDKCLEGCDECSAACRDCLCSCGFGVCGVLWPGKWSRGQGWRLRWYWCRDCVRCECGSNRALKGAEQARLFKLRRRNELLAAGKDPGPERGPDDTESDSDAIDGHADDSYTYGRYRRMMGHSEAGLTGEVAEAKAAKMIERTKRMAAKRAAAKEEAMKEWIAAGASQRALPRVAVSEEPSELDEDEVMRRVGHGAKRFSRSMSDEDDAEGSHDGEGGGASGWTGRDSQGDGTERGSGQPPHLRSALRGRSPSSGRRPDSRVAFRDDGAEAEPSESRRDVLSGQSPFFVTEDTEPQARGRGSGRVAPNGERWAKTGHGMPARGERWAKTGHGILAGGELRHVVSASALVPTHDPGRQRALSSSSEGRDEITEGGEEAEMAPRGARSDVYAQSLKRAQIKQALTAAARAQIPYLDSVSDSHDKTAQLDTDGEGEAVEMYAAEAGSDGRVAVGDGSLISNSKHKVGPFRRGVGDPVKEAQRRKRAERAAVWDQHEKVPAAAVEADERTGSTSSLSPTTNRAVSFDRARARQVQGRGNSVV